MEASADRHLKHAPPRGATPLAALLPKLAYHEVDAENALARFRGAFVFQSRFGEMWTRLCHRRAIDTRDIGFARLALTFDGQPATVWLPARAISAVASLAEPGVGLAEIPEHGRALLFEYVLDDLFDHLERLGHVVVIGAIGDPVRDPPGALGVVCQVGALPTFPGVIDAPPGLARFLLRAADRLRPPGMAFAETPVTVRVLAGATWLGPKAFAGLKQGDAVLLDRTWMNQRRAPVVVGETLLLGANVTSRGFALDGGGPVKDVRERAVWLADDLIGERTDMSEAETANLDGLEVKLVFEVGRFALSLAELNRLDAGHIFELNRAPDQAVDVYVLNKQVGSGELVLVGDKIGVRLTKLSR